MIPPRYNKYGNTKVILDGITFDSKKEANRYIELKLLERAGQIKSLQTQAPFVLIHKFTYKGKIERETVYICDFQYIENGLHVVEDVKGFRNDVYKLKRKLLLSLYPHIDFREL